MIDNKIITGSFYTVHNNWLRKHIKSFIETNDKIDTVLDPFAGEGHLLNVVLNNCKNISKICGYDIKGEKWKENDSLLHIPVFSPETTIIVTNPPFLAKNSARRKGIYEKLEKYYSLTGMDDLYQIAIKTCIEAVRFNVIIVPETFINSKIGFNGVKSCTILSKSPFNDTETPVCVLCIDRDYRGDTSFYLDDDYKISLEQLKKLKCNPSKNIPIQFNSPNGRIGFRAVDGSSPDEKIKFIPREEFSYDKEIINSSRVMTAIEISILTDFEIKEVCEKANQILNEYRKKCHDLLLSPFKGNNKNGIRRRRLDYKTARCILEMSVKYVMNENKQI